MESLQRIVSRQFNDLTQKRQSTQLKSYSDEFSSFDEPVSPSHESESCSNQFPTTGNSARQPIKKFTNKLKKTFRRIEQPCKTKCSFDDECVLKNKTMVEKFRNVKESMSSSQLSNDLNKLYKQAKVIDVRNGKLGRRTDKADNQNLLMFEELDNSH